MRTNKHNKLRLQLLDQWLFYMLVQKYESTCNVMGIEGLDYSEEKCQKRFNICC